MPAAIAANARSLKGAPSASETAFPGSKKLGVDRGWAEATFGAPSGASLHNEEQPTEA
jgi:hypothetical protein